MDLCSPYVVVVVFWSVLLGCWVYEGVHFYCYSEYVEVAEVEDV